MPKLAQLRSMTSIPSSSIFPTFTLPVASTSRIPEPDYRSSRRTPARPLATRALLTTPRFRVQRHQPDPADSSSQRHRQMSSMAEPTPTLSTPSIPFPTSFSSSSTTSHHGLTITPPSLQAIQEEGYLDDDVQLVPENDAWILVTPEAIKQLVSITSREPADLLAQGKLALRVGVESGGCHGYQYTMAITEERGVDDYVMQPEGVESIPVVIDLVSLGLLKGATLHHATELIGSSFRLQDNPQAKEGGACGCGVSWEAKI